MKIAPQASDRFKEEISPIHRFMQLVHQFFGMERIKRIVQNVHIENALVRFAQSVCNFGIFATLRFDHTASIPHDSKEIQENDKKFYRRNRYIEFPDFIHSCKSNIFIDIQDQRPATTEQRKRHQKLRLIRGLFPIRQMRPLTLHHIGGPLIQGIPVFRLKRPYKTIKVSPFPRFFNNKRSISTVHND